MPCAFVSHLAVTAGDAVGAAAVVAVCVVAVGFVVGGRRARQEWRGR